ncbi:hypothetical protein JB92DRAFT_2996732 [Gautieria morchelliformis]|nr:hypothetical protein JB92DRAFT_2996732 [Gautieria morchelliformis]
MPQMPVQELRIQLRGVPLVDRHRGRREHLHEVRDERHNTCVLLHVQQSRKLGAQHVSHAPNNTAGHAKRRPMQCTLSLATLPASEAVGPLRPIARRWADRDLCTYRG